MHYTQKVGIIELTKSYFDNIVDKEKYMNIHETIKKLLDSQLQVDALKDESVLNLKAVGRQFALMYRHAKDKESTEAKHILSTLIKIRKTVKHKLGVVDTNMERFEQKEF